jgi:hypothetical protein
LDTKHRISQFFRKGTENDGISPTGATNIPNQNPTTIQPVAKAYAAQSQERPQEPLTDKTEARFLKIEGDVTTLKEDVTTLKQDVTEIKDYLKVVKNHIDNNLVTKTFLTEQMDKMVTKDYLEQRLDKLTADIKQAMPKQNPPQ